MDIVQDVTGLYKCVCAKRIGSLSHASKENFVKIFNNAHYKMAYLTVQEGKLLWDDIYAIENYSAYQISTLISAIYSLYLMNLV